jgi:hypothetical protein
VTDIRQTSERSGKLLILYLSKGDIMKKKNEEQILHQHIDERGNTFGSLHPIDAKHKKEQTQKFHNLTIEKLNP